VERLIRKLAGRYGKLHLRYEAGRTGYGLYRRIQTLGHACLVIAPALIPSGQESGSRPTGATPTGPASGSGRTEPLLKDWPGSATRVACHAMYSWLC
jgi:hypothetical protein